MRIRSFAKINLGLEIAGLRPDGYHEIETLFQTVDLGDDLEVLPAGDGRICLEGDDASIPWDRTNLIFKAAEALRAETGTALGARIRVTKRIPAGRGLGGGSSNAAAALIALNGVWGLGLGPDRLKRLVTGLGSDTAYFLHGGLCLGRGRGELLTELDDPAPAFFVIGWPDYGVSTPAAFAAWKPSLTSPHKASKIKRFLEDGDFRHLENDLEATVAAGHPEIGRLKRSFLESGAALALMSGSGSAVFGLFADREKALAVKAMPVQNVTLVLTRTLTRKEYRNATGAGASPSW